MEKIIIARLVNIYGALLPTVFQSSIALSLILFLCKGLIVFITIGLKKYKRPLEEKLSKKSNMPRLPRKIKIVYKNLASNIQI